MNTSSRSTYRFLCPSTCARLLPTLKTDSQSLSDGTSGPAYATRNSPQDPSRPPSPAPQSTQTLSRLRIRPLARRLGLHLLLRDGQVIRPVGRVPRQVRLALFQPATRRPALLPALRELAARLRRVVVVFNVRLALGDGVRCGACEEGCCTYEAVSVVMSELPLGPLCVELCVREKGFGGLAYSGRLPLLFGVSIRRLSLGDCCSDAYPRCCCCCRAARFRWAAWAALGRQHAAWQVDRNADARIFVVLFYSVRSCKNARGWSAFVRSALQLIWWFVCWLWCGD